MNIVAEFIFDLFSGILYIKNQTTLFWQSSWLNQQQETMAERKSRENVQATLYRSNSAGNVISRYFWILGFIANLVKVATYCWQQLSSAYSVRLYEKKNQIFCLRLGLRF